MQTEFGAFTWDGCAWTSEPIATPMFNGARLQIQVFGSAEQTSIFTERETNVLRRFFALQRSHAEEVTPHLWQYYREFLEDVGPPDIPEISANEDIWQHVAPRFLVLDDGADGLFYVNIEAECAWEIEHGLQLVLQNGERWVRVSSYSGHLTDGDAYGRRSLDAWLADPAAKLPVRSLHEKLAAKR